MLLENGVINSRIHPNVASRKIRNGVGINKQGNAVFLLSQQATNFYDFAFPVIFGTITFFLAFLFPMLAIAMEDTSMFLSKFYNAYRIYDEQKKKEDREKLDMQSNSTCSNYSEYRRRY
jgi:hypothetical protein